MKKFGRQLIQLPDRCRSSLRYLDKAAQAKGLSLEETARLLQVEDPELNEAIFETARKVKQGIYGNRLVLFAPLYVTNECGNRCAYCGFKETNKELLRRTLSADEIRQEVTVLENKGHKRLLLVYGEHPKFGAEWIAETVRNVYDTVSEKSGEIRRVNINCARWMLKDSVNCTRWVSVPISVFRKPITAKLTPNFIPPDTRKTTSGVCMPCIGLWKPASMMSVWDAAGLYDYRFDTIALLAHAAELEAKYGVGPHTLSFPRLEPALNAEIAFNPPYPISDAQFKRLVAVLRLAVPYTGLILSTRENREMRRELLDLGISQLSAGSRTYPGAYSDPDYDRPDVQQFCIGDNRSLKR